MSLIVLCHYCDGAGRIKSAFPFIKKACPTCNGKGRIPYQRG